MALVPVLDLRPGEDHLDGLMPMNIEAEQALLGILLYESDQFWELPPSFSGEAFYDPCHGRIFNSIRANVNAGLRADPITLANEFIGDEGFKELGGISYLGRLVEQCPPIANAPHYAHVIMETFTRRRMIDMGKNLVQRASRDGQEEGGSAKIIADTEAELLQLTLTDHRLQPIDAKTAGSLVVARIREKNVKKDGIITGLPPLDLQLGPMQGGDMIVLGGRSGMGKTALSLGIALRVAAPQWWAEHEQVDALFGKAADHFALKQAEPQGAIFYCGEMNEEALARRCISDIGFTLFGAEMPTYQQIREQRVSVEQEKMIAKAQEILGSMPIMFLKRSGMTFSILRSVCRRRIASWARAGIKCGLIVGDHAGLFRAEGKTSGRYEAQTEIAINAKDFAGEVDSVLMMLVQLTRGVDNRDDKRAQLADLRDTGAWEECADAVLFPFREAYWARKEPEPKSMEAKAELAMKKKSKKLEVQLGKLRDGDPGDAAMLWTSIGHNAVRGSEPPYGDLVN